MTAGLKISCSDPIINLLGLLPAAFSFMAAFVNGAYNVKVISEQIGAEYLPLYSIIKPGFAAIFNIVYSKLKYKTAFSIIGCGSFVAACAMMWVFT